MAILAAIVSVLMHVAAIAVAALPGCAGAPPAKKPPETTQVKVPKPGSLEFTEQGLGRIHCPKWYAGLGLLHNWSGYVTELAPGGPAAQAGVRIGDVFLNSSDFGRDRFPAGTEMSMTLLRDGVEIALPITIGRVCFDER